MPIKKILQVTPVHPRQFKDKHKLSVYNIHRLSGYSPETISHWLANKESTRYQEPKECVLNHFGSLDLLLSIQSVR